MEISGFGVAGEVRSILWTKETTSGPARMARVLPMMRATFLGTVVANVAIVNCWLAVRLSWVVGRIRDGCEKYFVLDMMQLEVEKGELFP